MAGQAKDTKAEESERTMLFGVFLNLVLFAAKITVGILSNSLALLSDAFNSLTDIVSYSGIFFAVKISNKGRDHDHNFGHHRAEPIAGLVVAILAVLLAVQIVRTAIGSFFSGRVLTHEAAAMAVLVFTMAVKTGMWLFFTKIGTAHNRPAIRAAGIDSRNDVLVSGVALLGVFGTSLGYPLLDSFAAFIISLFIFASAYRLGRENIDYLMGKRPPKEEINALREMAQKVKGVKGVNTVRAQYAGNMIQIEIHIEVDKNITTEESHRIGKKVERALERDDLVGKAFVHIDPR